VLAQCRVFRTFGETEGRYDECQVDMSRKLPEFPGNGGLILAEYSSQNSSSPKVRKSLKVSGAGRILSANLSWKRPLLLSRADYVIERLQLTILMTTSLCTPAP
jgi:hypothetical protein